MNFEQDLKDLECIFKSQLKKMPWFQTQLEKLFDDLMSLTQYQTNLNQDQSQQEQLLYQEKFNQYMMQMQPFRPPPEAWQWSTWKQMDLQTQIKQTEQLKQLVEKYVVVVRYLIIEETLSKKLQSLSIGQLCVLNPLEYASDPHIDYVTKYCGMKKVLFLGINPSRDGMSQNGVPFGNMADVTGWLGISGVVNQPVMPCPNFTVNGFAHTTAEDSGIRFWGVVKEICGTPEVFFQNCFVHNYCPLLFLDASGNYLSLSDLNAATRQQFEPHCDQALRECVRDLGVGTVVAVGGYVSQRATQALAGMHVNVVQILHPSGLNRLNGGFTDDNDYIQKTRSVLGDNGIIPYMNPTHVYRPKLM